MSDPTDSSSISTCALKIIDLQALLEENPQECAKLSTAVKDEVFFYLDFCQVEGRAAILEMVEMFVSVSK